MAIVDVDLIHARILDANAGIRVEVNEPRRPSHSVTPVRQ